MGSGKSASTASGATMMSRRVLLAHLAVGASFVVGVAGSAFAQQVADTTRRTAPNTELPLIPTRALKFTTDEGTWLSLDVSPDGRTIVFDLLGDLYTLPLTGGKATQITRGMAFDGEPRYSPDGKSIVYLSDSSGAENVWTVDADGRNPRPVTKGQRTSFASPEWTPDGKYIVVSKDKMYPTFSWYDLYLYNR